MKKKLIFAIIALCMTICAFTAVGCGKKEEDGGSAQLPTLEFTQNTIEMILGESKQLPGLSLVENETVSYFSNNESIVTVSAEGLVESKAVGSAAIKATTSTGRTAIIEIIVYDTEFYPVPYISVAQNNFNLCVGDSFTPIYSYIYLGKEIEGTVSFSSDNPNVVAVEGNLLKAVGVGETYIAISGESAVGTATRIIKIAVTEKQTEFSSSLVGEELYVGSSIELILYANEKGVLKEVEGASFTVLDEEYAIIENGLLKPLLGGDTSITVAFEYDGKRYSQQIALHIYGPKTCSFYFADGTLDHTVQAVYGDIVPLNIENDLQNPEYNRAIKRWYVNGKPFDGDEFVMPDADVEVSVRYINETEDDFTASFSAGHLLSNSPAMVEYIKQPIIDSTGTSSDLEGCVQFTASFTSLCYNFDEPIVVTQDAKIQIKMFVPKDVMLLYFGYASNENWQPGNPTKRYEASAGIHETGDVPLAVIPMDKWTVLELPLTAFVDEVGDTLGGISISISNKYIYIDNIFIDFGIAEQDAVYMDNFLSRNIKMAELASEEQLAAIAAYKAWSLGLTEEQKATETHQANVEMINALIEEYFMEEEANIILPNKATVEVSGTTTGQPAGQPNVYYHSSNWRPEDIYVVTQTETYEYLNFAHYNAADAAYTATYTLAKVNFSQYKEVYFGVTAATAEGDCTINVNGASYTYDVSAGYLQMKVIVSGNILTIVGDGVNNVGQTLATVELSEAIVNGEEALTLTWSTAGWSHVEITEMRATVMRSCRYDAVIENIPAGWGATGTRVEEFETKFLGTHQKTFDASCDYKGEAVLVALNYNAYDEVYFGFHAVAGARAWDPYDGDNGILTINGAIYELEPNIGDYYFKVTVKNGVLTLEIENSRYPVENPQTLSVELSEEVLNGTEGLTISLAFGGAWSQAEITEIHTIVVVDKVE